MKKLVLAVASLVTVISLQAQHPHPHWGLKGGINVSNIKVEQGTDPESRIGLHLGGLAHIHLSEHFALQPELMYSNQGAKRQVGGTEYKTKFHYVNVPVLVQFMTGSGFRLQTGPQLGLLVSAKSKVNDTETDVDDAYETADFAWSFGASYVTMKGLGFDARYNHGITNILDGGGNEYKNRVFQFGIFYQFRVTEYRRK